MRHLISNLLLLVLPVIVQCMDYGGPESNVQRFKDRSDFLDRVINSDSIWLVQFYDPLSADCKKLEKDWEGVASVLKGIVHVAAVDASDGGPEKGIASEYGSLLNFPTIQIYAGDKKRPTAYKGDRDPQSIMQATMSELSKLLQQRGKESGRFGGGGGGSERPPPPREGSLGLDGSKVVQLEESNFKEKVLDNPEIGLIAFVAPWCGHCKTLLPDWAEASEKLGGTGAYLGVVDATVSTSLAATFGVKGYPTIKVFPGGPSKSPSDAVDYEGGRTPQQIVQYALAEVDRTGTPKEIPELTGPEGLEENCSGTNRICILVALPHILETGAEGRNKYKDTIATVAKTFRGTAFNFVWFEGSSQPDLEEKLEMTFGFPAVTALSMDKEVYTVQRGSFSERNIGKFLTGITTGRQPTVKLQKMPEVYDVEPWDGEDGTPIEEPSLEDIMGDEL